MIELNLLLDFQHGFCFFIFNIIILPVNILYLSICHFINIEKIIIRKFRML